MATKKRQYRSSATAGNSPIEEHFTLPSETVPNQSMSVQEILTRFASGTLPNIMREQTFSEDLPDLRGLDISELYQMKEDIKQDISYLDNELATRAQEIQLSKLSKKTENVAEATIEPLTP